MANYFQNPVAGNGTVATKPLSGEVIGREVPKFFSTQTPKGREAKIPAKPKGFANPKKGNGGGITYDDAEIFLFGIGHEDGKPPSSFWIPCQGRGCPGPGGGSPLWGDQSGRLLLKTTRLVGAPKEKGRGFQGEQKGRGLRFFLWKSKRDLPFGQGFGGVDPPEERGVVAIDRNKVKGSATQGEHPGAGAISPCPLPPLNLV